MNTGQSGRLRRANAISDIGDPLSGNFGN
jgi:hypothetical protein